MPEAIVCGAGAAGLAAAATLRGIGAEVAVLERSGQVGASWRARYEGLRLNTTGLMSSQPGFRAGRRRYGEFPTRDSWVQYLEDYAAHHRLDVRFATDVQRVDAANGGWRVRTGDGDLDARFVVVATGFDHDPDLPRWPGRETFTGELIHAAAYRSPEPYRDRDVLVVGPNTTGSELAALIVRGGAARVRLASRTPPNLVTRKLLGVPVNVIGLAANRLPLRAADRVGWLMQRARFGNLERHGIPRAPVGVATTARFHGRGPAYDDGFVSLLKSGAIEVVPAVAGFEGPDVLLADGSRTQPDAVIAATGYRRGLEPLVGHLGVLGDDGIPLVYGGGQVPAARGLFFTGYRIDLGGQLRLMRFDARSIARAVKRVRAA